jgi:hypothetical protein
MTPLARALAAMEAAPEDAAARLAFFHEFAASEVHVPGGAHPELFETSEGPMILAFDDEAALADFATGPVERASLPGRALVQALLGSGVGVMVKTEAGEAFVDPAALDWLSAALAGAVEETEDVLADPAAPRDLPPDLLAALDRAFGRMAGLVRRVWLFEASGHLVLALEGAAEPSRAALSRSIAEAVRFSGWDGALDVTFVDGSQAERLKGRALRIDLPEPPPRVEKPKDQPPRLR